MVNLGELAHAVQTNCHISDARHAGSYSMCIFLLKMREYYRWENEIPLSQRLDKSGVSQWMLEREQAWEEFEERPYLSLPLASGDIDPFDSRLINAELETQGLIYSSGYGLFGKPNFFLGQLKKAVRKNGVTIYISTCEYARDLVAPPAMSMDGDIFIREESLRRFIWEKIEEWQWKKDQHAPMARALNCYKKEPDLEHVLDHMCANESHNVLLHEIGETEAGKLLGTQWKDMLNDIPRSKTELQMRAVRDHLADCLSTLPSLIEEEKLPSIHFYFANFTAMRKELFPTAFAAYHKWADGGDLKPLKKAAEQGRQHWHAVASELLDNWRSKGAEHIARFDELISPL